ncbi:MAG: 16S rRNA (adenine(1518)-N(6)/adenine(1519)-N(6))-dimethyltransferase RsmA, partial [Clostridia bacterium]|nr:16S rRNA (adenine(1518)-N(6)/adenine(1519)-N(6))-dimethyltransferase RsmA [Clostridia bacterium]
MSDFVFKKKFGQNFISDKNLLQAIVSDAEISAEDEVLEIGAGAGSLTQVLSQSCKKVVSFEIDKDLQFPLLALNLKNVQFEFSDFMQSDMKEIESRFGKGFKVVANLPYYITTPIIFRLLEESEKLESLTIMVQKEVAERVCAKAGGKDYGILTVMTNFYGQPSITRIIKRQMFYPAPNVDSALLHIKIERDKFKGVDKKKFSNFVKACFSMRRKTLLNNLGSVYGKEKLKELLDEQTLQKRAEVFTLEEFIEI